MSGLKKIKVISIICISLWIVSLIALMLLKIEMLKVITPALTIGIYFMHGVFALTSVIFILLYKVTKSRLENN